MEIKKFIGPVVLSSLALNGCDKRPDIANNIYLRYQTDSSSTVVEALTLNTDQSFLLAGLPITVMGPGRIHIGIDADSDRSVLQVQGPDLYVKSAGKTYKINEYTSDDEKTRILITFNCADPANP